MLDAYNIDEKLMKTPYFLLLLLPLLSISWPIMEWSLYLVWLCVPISVWASVRYRWRGFEMIAIGGLLLPIELRTDLILIPSDFGIYLSCLLLSSLTALNRPINSTLKSFKVTPGLAIAILLLPINIEFISELDFDLYNIILNAYDFKLIVAFYPLLFLLMFLLGLAKAHIKMLMFLLFMAVCFGIAIKIESSCKNIRYDFNNFADYLALISWYFFGLYFRKILNDQKSTNFMYRRPRTTLMLLIFLWGGVVLWEFIPRLREDDLYLYLRCFIPSGAWYALPLAALYAGMNFQLRGVIIIIFSTIFYELLYVSSYVLWLIFIDSEKNIMIYLSAIISKESPIIGTAFAILGKKIIGHYRICSSEK